MLLEVSPLPFQNRKSKKYLLEANHLLPSPIPKTVVLHWARLSNELSLIKIPLIMNLVDIEEPLLSKNDLHSLPFLWCLTQMKTGYLYTLQKWRLITSLLYNQTSRSSFSLYALSIWETLGIERMLSPTFHCLDFNSPSVSVKGP